MRLPEADFRDVCAIAQQHLGIELRPGKEALVSARLADPMRRGGFETLHDYLQHVKRDSEGQAMLEFIDCLTTNHTGFLREPSHFEFWQQEVLVRLRQQPTIPVWCAASSSGEEPFTLAMCAIETLGEPAYHQVKILATDISPAVLAHGRRGIYRQERLEPLPEAWRRRYFLKGEGRWEGHFRVKPELSQMVDFQRVNLIEPLPRMGSFPAIFCRNVMIYFNASTRALVVEQMRSRLDPDGYLFVGHAESLNGLGVRLEYVMPSVYRLGRAGEEKG